MCYRSSNVTPVSVTKHDPLEEVADVSLAFLPGGSEQVQLDAQREGGGLEVISMGLFLSVRALHQEGIPKKAIARRLGIDRRTVRKYLRRIEAGALEPRRARVASKLDRFRVEIEAKVLQGLSAVQIYQDLCQEPGFAASYETVKRLVRLLRRTEPEVYCRMRYGPGEEAQIDFGELGRLPVEGRARKVYLFVMTLCHSRYAYYELVTDQRVPSFLGAIRNGFEFFGGAPRRLKPDYVAGDIIGLMCPIALCVRTVRRGRRPRGIGCDLAGSQPREQLLVLLPA